MVLIQKIASGKIISGVMEASVMKTVASAIK